MSPIKIAIADPHPIVVEGLCTIFSNTHDIEVSFHAHDGNSLIERLNKLSTQSALPDVCIFDINLKNSDGFETTSIIKQKWPNISILIFTSYDYKFYFIRMVLCGANGLLSKSSNSTDIVSAVRKVNSEGLYYSDIASKNFIRAIVNKELKAPTLSAMEITVLKLSCSESSYREIGKALGLSAKSIEGCRDSLFRKLNVRSRVTMAMMAIKLGYVQLSEVVSI